MALASGVLVSVLVFLYSLFIYPIIYIFPAYAANGAPVLFGGGKPLDFKAKIRNRRVFGDHKTIRGTVSSFLAGIAIGLIEYPFLHYMLPVAILLTVGANFGDLLGSFIKRQLGIGSGRSFPVMDQYGFFVFAVIFAYVFKPGVFPAPLGFLFLVVLTGLMHVLTNRGAYKLKLKEVPW
ncbi:CDP-2,3-bis-(O-geranylgeranyl)-sn-glycerol synthase [Candidatus Marsarchaeota archaeon]|nr:CDP-2,3-bis-(O-geranylgeranyl)-sn-glycerol synthase [Candidatus Marsarchaeota archaeon]